MVGHTVYSVCGYMVSLLYKTNVVLERYTKNETNIPAIYKKFNEINWNFSTNNI